MTFSLIQVDIYCSKFQGWKILSGNELAKAHTEFFAGVSRKRDYLIGAPPTSVTNLAVLSFGRD